MTPEAGEEVEVPACPPEPRKREIVRVTRATIKEKGCAFSSVGSSSCSGKNERSEDGRARRCSRGSTVQRQRQEWKTAALAPAPARRPGKTAMAMAAAGLTWLTLRRGAAGSPGGSGRAPSVRVLIIVALHSSQFSRNDCIAGLSRRRPRGTRKQCQARGGARRRPAPPADEEAHAKRQPWRRRPRPVQPMYDRCLPNFLPRPC
jgi:hypothetical protein